MQRRQYTIPPPRSAAVPLCEAAPGVCPIPLARLAITPEGGLLQLHRCFLLAFVVACLLGLGCDGGATSSESLRLAVTTSTRDSGLLQELVPLFESQLADQVHVVAVGTGRALQLGESGDVDVLLVHSRAAEEAFMAAGHGVRRIDVMYNDFILLGPPDDPATVAGLSAAEALQRIAAGRHRFVSRGDNSGTHEQEKSLWRAGGGARQWDGYLEGGRGMGATLILADQIEAYVLSDRGTWLRFRTQVDLHPWVEDPERLRNTYGALVVNPDKHPRINVGQAHAFLDFLQSPTARRAIRDFRVNGEPLFLPFGEED